VDSNAESEIVETLHALRSDRTILVAAHRAGVLARCDLVIEMRNGSVVGNASGGWMAAAVRRYS
jgi:ABC-type transport system involved in cytochrome bd biosynthesis fused ATPase/permease subunit